ncbi:unnamed protein product [Closterium sp. NIES-65]|nr:unnamed protein product [Closterium sp. NIES-65]
MSGAILAALHAVLLPACRASLARTSFTSTNTASLQLLRGISHLQSAFPFIQKPSQREQQPVPTSSTIQDSFRAATSPSHSPATLTQAVFQFHRAVAAMAGMRPAAHSEREQQEAEPLPGLRRTVWGQLDLKPRFPKLESHVHADVAVIGGGIAGLSIAYQLQRKGKSTVLLERRCIGQTGRTTAHIMAWNDDFYMNLEKSFGRDNTGLVAESHRQAIACIEDTVARERIDCKFSRLDGYLFPHDSKPSTLETLHLEYEACKRAGFTDVYMADLNGDPALGSVHKAICFPSTAEFHPLMYLSGVADAFVRHGGCIFEQTVAFREEGSVTGTGAGVVVASKDGRGEVQAGAVVLATNSPINHNLLVHARQPADRSYVVGLHLPKGSVKRANWWDTASPYHYVRVEEQEGRDVLVVGGGDHPVGMPATQYHDVWGDLERWARPRWPMAQQTLFRWSGMVRTQGGVGGGFFMAWAGVGLPTRDFSTTSNSGFLHDFQLGISPRLPTRDFSTTSNSGFLHDFQLLRPLIRSVCAISSLFFPPHSYPAVLCCSLHAATHAWQVYEPVDFLGLYGRNPMDSTNTYIATGDSGQGMTGGTIAAMIISDLICRRPNPFVEIYSPSRLPPLSKESLSLAGSVVSHTFQGYKDRLPQVGTDGVEIEELGRGCGAVVRMGGGKAAVFRDKDGCVHAFSATCPHMGCSVHWNPNDTTFDCPCHGSQFDHRGRCINGPAKADLAPLDPAQTG